MIKPNLFIVGAAKSGTTTLYSYLEKHSQVFMPADELYKEPAFFSSKGEKLGFENYMNIFSNAKSAHQYIGEASTAYLTDPTSAKRIYDFNPGAKIIIILRNPSDRAYSLYNWMVQEGYEYAKSFEKALVLEKKRKKKKIPNFFEPEYYWNYMYSSSGLYYEQVKRYKDLFDENNILIIKFEDMTQDINNTYKDVSVFLKINYEEINVEKENESKMVYNPLLSFLGRKITKIINRLMKGVIRIDQKHKKDKIIYLLQKNNKPEAMNINTKKELLEKYLYDIKMLEELIDKDLSNWINKGL